MIPRAFLLAVVVLSLLPVFVPASATTLYTWRNTDGSIMFTDNPKGAPAEVQVHVWAEVPFPPSPPTPPESDAVSAVPAAPVLAKESDGPPVTQGEFAVQLAAELGLGDASDENTAADILSQVRIAPRLGQWRLDEPLTPELTYRLRRLTIAATQEGWLELTPEQGLLAFDAAAALLGVTIPPEGDDWDQASRDSSDIADSPPLVYVLPPPVDIYPYYLWMPVDNGFWRNGVFVTGVFVLNTDRFFFRHRHRHRVAMTPDHIGRHFGRHVTPNHPAFNPSPRPHRVWQSSGSSGSTDRPQRRFVAPRSTGRDQTIHSSPGPSQRSDRPTTARSIRHSRPAVRSITPTPINPASEEPSVSTVRSSGGERHRGHVGRGQGRNRGFSHD